MRIFQNNIFSYLHIAKVAVLRSGDAHIATSSVAAFKGHGTLIDYFATKCAIQRRVWTPLIPARFGVEKTSHSGGQVLMDQVAQPSEIAPAQGYLASVESSCLTGQMLHPNGV